MAFSDLLSRLLPPEVLGYLGSDEVQEVYANPDGAVWTDGRAGRVRTGTVLASIHTTAFLNAVATHEGRELTDAEPDLQAELPADPPFSRARLQAFVPPITAAPAFILRKRARRILLWPDLVAAECLSPAHYRALRQAVEAGETLLVSGGTGSGKTNFLIGLVHEIAAVHPRARLIVLEDTPEISSPVADTLFLRTTPTRSMRDLLFGTLRAHPDILIVGEVRDEAAYTLLNAFDTGHAGGGATVHANDPAGALARLNRLAQQAGVPPQHELVAQVVQLVVHLQGTSAGRGVKAVARVQGVSQGAFLLQSIAP